MLFKNPAMQFIVLFLICLGHYYWIFPLEQVSDALIFWPVRNFPGVDSLSYFRYIFTHLNGHAGQYRPLGFFVYFYVLGNLFGDHSIFYHILSLVMITLVALLLKKWAENHSRLEGIGWICALYYLFHGTITFPLLDISCGGKYILTALIFVLEITIIDGQRGRPANLTNGLILMALNATAILLHEGCIVFPVALAVYDRLQNGRTNWQSLPSFIPSALALALRLFVVGLPKQGIMKMGVSRIFELFNKAQSLLWNPVFAPYESGYLAFFLVLSCSLYIWIKSTKRGPGAFVLMNIVLLAPFLLLENHLKDSIYLKGCFWATVPCVFFLVSVTNYALHELKIHRRIVLSALALLVLLEHGSSFYLFNKLVESGWSAMGKVNSRYVSEVARGIERKSDMIRIVSPDIQEQPPFAVDSKGWIYQSQMLPGLLIRHFPETTFIIARSGWYDAAGLEMEILVHRGYYAYIQKKQGHQLEVIDRFGYRSLIPCEFPNNIPTLNINMMPYYNTLAQQFSEG